MNPIPHPHPSARVHHALGLPLLAALVLGGSLETERDETRAPTPDDATVEALAETNTGGVGEAMASFWEAMKKGRAWIKLNYRYETVDQAGVPLNSYASTLRTVLGYESAAYHGFSGLLEFEDVSPIGNADKYRSPINGVVDRPLVPDSDSTEINQVYGQYARDKDIVAKVGRQEIQLDNLRFVGGVKWRQNTQTFDSASAFTGWFPSSEVFYAYVDNVNRVVGDLAANGDLASNTNLVNANHTFGEFGKLAIYAYILDFLNVAPISSTSLGARFAGKAGPDSLDVLYEAEYAHQMDSGNNPNQIDANYYHGVLGLASHGVTVKGGYESLGGSTRMGGAFQTPLATLHKFNGWADKFLVTPDTGLNDLYVSLTVKVADLKLQGLVHWFDSTVGSTDYGEELDLLAYYPIDDHLAVGIKWADYRTAGNSAFNGDADTAKLWIWTTVSF